MPALYLQGSDATAYGAATATPQQIQQASAQIDTYLSRREGLLYGVDGGGNPAYMLGLNAQFSLTLTASIAPGTSVSAIVTGPVSMIQVGAVFVIDIGTPSITEALVVQSITGTTLIFANVKYAHASGATLADGLLIAEQRTMPQNRPITQLSRWPIVAMPSGVGRYGYMRRGDDGYSQIDTYNLLAVMSKFGGPPAWEPFTPEANSIDPNTGTFWVPAGVLLAYYTEVRVHYIAGWTYTSLPGDIKQACANIINAANAQSGVPGNVQKYAAGTFSIQRFAGRPGEMNSALIDDDTKVLLAPYRARIFV